MSLFPRFTDSRSEERKELIICQCPSKALGRDKTNGRHLFNLSLEPTRATFRDVCPLAARGLSFSPMGLDRVK